MSTGSGDGASNGPAPKKGGWVSSRRPDPESVPRPVMSPEQGCITCSVGVGAILLAVLFWVFIYWRYEPAFHPPGTTPRIPFDGKHTVVSPPHLAPTKKP